MDSNRILELNNLLNEETRPIGMTDAEKSVVEILNRTINGNVKGMEKLAVRLNQFAVDNRRDDMIGRKALKQTLKLEKIIKSLYDVNKKLTALERKK